MPKKPKGIGPRYCDLPLDEQLKIYDFVMKEAARMQKLNYHELARIAQLKFGVLCSPKTIWDWIVKGKSPLRHPKYGMNTKALRKPPDDDIIPDFLGLIHSDLHFRKIHKTLFLSTSTTYYIWAKAIADRFSAYGYTSVRPVLCGNAPEWRANVYLDAESWNDAFISPLELSRQDAIRFLARFVDGDGWIGLNSDARTGNTYIHVGMTTSYRDKAYMLKEVISNKIGWKVSFRKSSKYKENILEDGHIIRTKRPVFWLIIYRKDDVDEFLRNVKMLHPLKEVKRCWALKILNEEMDREQVLKIWRGLHIAGNIIKICGQLMAIDQLMETYMSKGRWEGLKRLSTLKERLSNKLSSLTALLKPTIEGDTNYSFSITHFIYSLTPLTRYSL